MRSAVLAAMASVQCVYTFAVVPMSVCPSALDTSSSSAPASSCRVAKAWRKSWKRWRGSPATARMACRSLVTLRDSSAPFDLSDWPVEGKPFGPREARETFAYLRSFSPDLRIEIEELLADGDQVVAWLRATGSSPSGRRGDFRHAHRFRLRDGLIVEHWAVRDDLRAMVQAGVVAPPGPPN